VSLLYKPISNGKDVLVSHSFIGLARRQLNYEVDSDLFLRLV